MYPFICWWTPFHLVAIVNEAVMDVATRLPAWARAFLSLLCVFTPERGSAESYWWFCVSLLGEPPTCFPQHLHPCMWGSSFSVSSPTLVIFCFVFNYSHPSQFEVVLVLFTVSPLHMNLQVVNFQRRECAFACPVTQVSSRVWHALSSACFLYKLLCFCVLYCIE